LQLFDLFLCPQNQKSGGILFLSCLSCCLSFCHLLKTLALAITFEWYVLGLWYFTRIFLVTRPLHGYKKFDLVTLSLVFDLLIENFNLGYIFWLVGTRALTFHTSVCCYKTLPWVLKNMALWPWCKFDLHIENFNFGYSFWIVCTRTWTFHMTVPCEKTFPWLMMLLL
jgi:hypothetical protein